MHHKKYKTDKGRKFGVQRTKSNARHRWYEYIECFGWCATLRHKKPRTDNPVRIKFRGRENCAAVFVGYDYDRNWKHKRFIVERYADSKSMKVRGKKFLYRVGWRKAAYGDY